MTIHRAKYDSIPLSEGLKLSGKGQLWMEKMDGVWAVRETEFCTLVGEQMNDGKFWAFDCISVHSGNFGGLSRDISGFSFKRRWMELCRQLVHIPLESRIEMVDCGTGAEFLEAVLANGGEGVVIADLDAPYGTGLTKCKRMESWDLLVTEKHPEKASIHLGNVQGEDFGWCPARAAYDQIRVGDIVEIEAFGRHASGKLREARIAVDKFGNPKIRHDKMGI